MKAASLASVPELARKVLEVPGRAEGKTSPSSSSARRTWAGEVKKFEMWPSVETCSLTAATTAGWAWPRQFTAMPASRSMYSVPSASHTWAPRPRTRTRAGVPKVFMTAPV